MRVGDGACPGENERVGACPAEHRAGQNLRATRKQEAVVVITTNEERALPEPFLRRCVVLNLRLPGDDEDPSNPALKGVLLKRGLEHFPKASKAVLQRAATDLLRDRHAAFLAGWKPLPGQAEYLDLIRAALASAPDKPEQQLRNLKAFSKFILRKQVAS